MMRKLLFRKARALSVVLGLFLIALVVGTAQTASAAITSISVGSPYSMVTSLDGSRIYVAGYVTDNVTIINTATNNVIATTDLGAGFGPRSVTLSADGQTLFVTSFFTGDLVTISTATNQVTSTTALGLSYPFGAALSPAGNHLIVVGQDFIYKIDATTKAVVGTISISGVWTYGAVFSPDGTKAYVTAANIDRLYVINFASMTITDTVVVGDAPQGIVITPDGSKIFVANQLGNSTSVLTTSNNQVVATIPALYSYNGVNNYTLNPIQLAINPAGTRVFVIGTSGRRVQVLDVATQAPIAGNPTVFVIGEVAYTGVVSRDGNTLYVGCVGTVGAGGQAVYIVPMVQFGNLTAPNATVGTNYSFSPNAINTASYSLLSGSLPTGLTLNSATGQITGTPTVAGTYSFTILATGDVDNSQNYQIQVDAALAKTGIRLSPTISTAMSLFAIGIVMLVFRQKNKNKTN